jgi:glycosyltransferase involved in cell wall biosynthesis
MKASPHRILLVEMNEDGTTGGSHQAQFDLVRHLDRSRFEPVVVFYQDNRFVEMHQGQGVEVHVLEEMRTRELDVRIHGALLTRATDILVGAVSRRARFLKEHRIDLLHLNNSPGSGNDDWLPAARIARIPCVASARGNPPRGLSPVHARLARQFDRILIISDHVMRAYRADGYPDRILTMVPDGVDLEALRARVTCSREEMRARLEIPPGRLVATMVGNIREWKGQHVVLEALGRLRREVRDRIFLLVAGDGDSPGAPYFQSLLDLQKKYGLQDMVRFLGTRQDVPDLLTASDMAIHASVLPEPFGLVVVEAMGLGVPVIAARLGAPADVVAEGSGLLFDPTSPGELAAALARLVEEHATREALRRGALARAQDFSVQRTMQALEAVYGELLPEGG